MHTIFITSFHPLISRNILLTPAFRQLTERDDLQIVLLVPVAKAEYFRKTFGGPAVAIAAIEGRLGVPEYFLRQLSFLALDSATVRIKRNAEFAATGKRARFFIKAIVSWAVAGRAWSRSLLRLLDRWLGSVGNFPELISKYRPAFVFSTDIQNEFDLQLLRAARRVRVPTVGMIRSWDNLTAKGVIRFVPDRLLVTGEAVRREAIRHCGVPETLIEMIGVPHYDSYRTAIPTARDEFFRSVGLDPGARLVLVAPIGDRYICEFRSNCRNSTDRYLIESLVRIRDSGTLPAGLQFLIRLPPTDTVDLSGFTPPPGMIFDQPGVGSDGCRKEQELSAEDDRRLIDALTYADIVVTGPSTIAVDAALFDRPIIVTGLEPAPKQYAQSIIRFYDYDHFRSVMNSGGVRFVRTEAELGAAMQAYLDDPSLDRDGRARILREQCGPLDGAASDRLVRALSGMLSRTVAGGPAGAL